MARPRQEFLLAYDSGCGPCSKFRALVGFFDARRRIRFAPLEAVEVSGLFGAADRSSWYASFHLIRFAGDGSRGGSWSGSEALEPLAVLLSPWGEAARAFFGSAPIKGLLSSLYSALSRLHRTCPTAQAPNPGGA